ncbi:hypothetical protein BDF14DRAFT_1770738 [Spinellus fusiger]|nr:hypothetical protein BDF14DRAFT_1770738 [Spinellus fusiger]
MNSDSNAYTMEHNSDYDFEQDFMEEEEEESQQSRQEQLQDMSFRDSSVTTTTTTTHSKTDSKKQGLDQAELRKKIIEIQQNTSIDSKQKAQKVQVNKQTIPIKRKEKQSNKSFPLANPYVHSLLFLSFFLSSLLLLLSILHSPFFLPWLVSYVAWSASSYRCHFSH